MDLSKFLRKLYLLAACEDANLILPVYTLMFISRGISISQVAILLSTWSAAKLFLKVPSGMLADKYSRKNILAIGYLFRAIGLIIWWQFPSFWGFFLGFVFWGIKSAFTSGSFEAYVFDELSKLGEDRNYEKIMGRYRMIKFITLAGALSLGGYLSKFGYNYILVQSLLMTLVTAVLAYMLPNAKIVRSTEEQKYFQFLVTLIKDVRMDYVLLAIVAAFVLIMGSFGAIDEYVPVLLDKLDFSATFVGIFFAIMTIIYAVASEVSHKLEDSKFGLKSLGYLMGYLMIGLGIGHKLRILFIPSFLLVVLLSALIDLKLETAIQQRVGSHKRATLLSIQSLLKELFSILMTLAIGVLIDKSGLTVLLTGLGITYLGLIFLLQGQFNRALVNRADD